MWQGQKPYAKTESKQYISADDAVKFEISGEDNVDFVKQDHFTQVFMQPLRQLSMLGEGLNDTLPLVISAAMITLLLPETAVASDFDFNSAAQQLYQH